MCTTSFTVLSVSTSKIINVLSNTSSLFRNDFGSIRIQRCTAKTRRLHKQRQIASTKVRLLRGPGTVLPTNTHAEHCFDFLRQSVMCLADVGIITYQWSDDRLVPIANSTTHQCADWKKLDDWTKKRTVDMMKPGWLIHPSKGMPIAHLQGRVLIFSQDTHTKMESIIIS